jgi:hypothetical protein
MRKFSSERLDLFLCCLTATGWSPKPKHIGLKTIIQAKDLQYAEGQGDFPHRAFRLTIEGKSYLVAKGFL